jgi:hypothetical protein
MNAEEFIEKNYYCLKIDCSRDIHTIYQAIEDYAKSVPKPVVIYNLCECGGNERVALDCTLKSCKHPKYCKK